MTKRSLIAFSTVLSLATSCTTATTVGEWPDGGGPGGGGGGAAGATGGNGGSGVGGRRGAGGGSGAVAGGGGVAASGGAVGSGGSGIAGAIGSGGTSGSAGHGGSAGTIATGGVGSGGGPATGGTGVISVPGATSICASFQPRSGPVGTLSFDLGHAASISFMRVSGDRILSRDTSGHWILWNSVTKKALLTGDTTLGIDLAGNVLVAATSPTAAEIHSAVDGQFTGTLALPGGAPNVGPGGAYLWSAGSTALRAWSPTGTLMVDVAGDYSQAMVGAVATELRVALGPAGAGVIEHVNLTTAARTTSPFTGTFVIWFADGNRFISHTGDNIRINAQDGTQEQFLAASAGAWMTAGGYGNYFWTGVTTVYQVGGATPVAIENPGDFTQDYPGYIAGFTSWGSLLVISGTTVFVASPTLPTQAGAITQFAAGPEGHWAAGTDQGLVYDGRDAPPRTSLTCGNFVNVTGAPSGDVVFGLSTHELVVAKLGTAGPVGMPYRLPIAAATIQLTGDGSELATSSPDPDYSSGRTDPQLKLLSLPTATPVATWLSPGLASGYKNLHVSGNGALVSFTRTVIMLAQGISVRTVQGDMPVYLTPTIGAQVAEVPVLAPGGHLFATGQLGEPDTSNIYRDGTLVNAVDGFVGVWLDDNHLVTSLRVFDTPGATQGTYHVLGRVYDATGTLLSSVPMPQLVNAVAVGTDRVYSSVQNSIYSIATGAAVWTGAFPAPFIGLYAATDGGAVAGAYVVYISGHEVIAERY